MMVVWIKCFECTHFACEQTGRFDCAAFLPQKGIPAPVYGAPMTLPHCGSTCELVLYPWEISIFVSFSMQVKMPAYGAGSYGHLLPLKMDFRWPLIYPLATHFSMPFLFSLTNSCSALQRFTYQYLGIRKFKDKCYYARPE